MAGWTCASCDGGNPSGTRFCGHCGIPREGSWTCASCGSVNLPAMRFCGACGIAHTAAEVSAGVADAVRSFVAGQVGDRLIEDGGLPEERRLITALFADISGFTGLADRLDPEQLLEVIDPIVSGLSSIVGRYEGYVEKYAGDALLALFGAPVSHEDDAERALRVSLEMHGELARICEGLPAENRNLTLHVGINSGHGVARMIGSEARTDYAVLGDAVILAQRLESAAPGGETYVSDTTYRMTQHRFHFEPVGELTLKGKAAPVRAWRLLGERATADGAAVRSRLVGREAELAAVSDVLDGLAAGRGAAVIVTGEAGVGKSRLTEEARGRAEAAGIRWLAGRCLSYGAGLAYWPYAELLRGVDDLPDDPFFARLLGRTESAEVHGLEPEAFRRGLHGAFEQWLEALARERPTILALDDLHWVDSASLALTAELAARSDGSPLGLYLTARPEGMPALAEIAPGACTIALEPFGRDALEALLEGLLGATPHGLAELVHERTEGNPFFVEELLRSLQETGALQRESDGGWRLRRDWSADALPPTVEGVLSARIDVLPRPAASLLGTASVIGRRVPLPLLERVADQDDLPVSVEELCVRGLLDRSPGDGDAPLVFHHALVQDVAYGRLLRRHRRDLHRRVAEVAEELYGVRDDAIDLLARHLYLGEAGEKAVVYLVQAGERARSLYANQEAIVHLSRARELAPDSAEIALALADLRELVGDYAEALRLYDEIRESTGDVRAWCGKASTLRKQGRYDEALDLLQVAFTTEALRGADLAPLWLENAWTLTVAGRFEEAADVVQAALEALGKRRDRVVGHLLIQLARAESACGRLDESLEHGLEARKILEREGDLRGLATAMRVVGASYASLKRFADAIDALRYGLELAERVGNVEEIGGCLIGLGVIDLQRGELNDAVAWTARASEEFERVGHGSGRAIALGNMAEMLAAAGRYDDALEQCERALGVAAEIGHTLTTADVTRTIASIVRQQGDYPRAAARAEEAANLFLTMGALPDAVASLELAADAWDDAGDAEWAGAARSRARALAAAA